MSFEETATAHDLNSERKANSNGSLVAYLPVF